MIALELARMSFISRPNFFSLFSPTGKAYLSSLLEAELEVANKFNLSFDTPELRKLEAKSKRSELTEEEQTMLNKGKKGFHGALAAGGVIPNKEVVAVINKQLSAQELAKSEIKYLSSFKTSTGTQASGEVIFEKEISYWNLHPQTFGGKVYEVLFDSPEYARRELQRLFELKRNQILKIEPDRIFADDQDIQFFMVKNLIPVEDRVLLLPKFRSLMTLGELDNNKYKEYLSNAIKVFRESDQEFNMDLYPEVSRYLPNYHNKKVRWLIYAIAQYNSVESVSVSNRISLQQIYAFYRKADELCSC